MQVQTNYLFEFRISNAWISFNTVLEWGALSFHLKNVEAKHTNVFHKYSSVGLDSINKLCLYLRNMYPHFYCRNTISEDHRKINFWPGVNTKNINIFCVYTKPKNYLESYFFSLQTHKLYVWPLVNKLTFIIVIYLILKCLSKKSAAEFRDIQKSWTNYIPAVVFLFSFSLCK